MALEAGVLTVTVEAAHDLKDPEWVSRQDPYCVISVGGQTFRTRTAVDGGRNPVWNETFRFDVGHAPDTGGTAEVVEVVVKADQLVEHDATLGSASIPLATARQTAGTDCYHTRAAIVSPQHHRVHGAVSLALRWDPASSSCSGSGSGEQVPAGEQPCRAALPMPQQQGQDDAQQQQQQQQQQQGQQRHHHHHGGGTPRERVDVIEFVEQRPVA
ncbi:hypothetical protein CHLRE_11g467595v5 [Chlamydomonas reinhardtii]|uniref:C2 domain-containing protein n=1 Tax=Chlamydomonas reinhardtii TaxID=3055 RepID=A0A2K3D7D5_CHLRE|nr:uncharacterized protein CHLRE_11g467595v5 [Chlamydomonas reinhardtii]PNW76448.1 hypothetical protein CHLRE_11g467595v5 [Chlamydomonas reinhardtii]